MSTTRLLLLVIFTLIQSPVFSQSRYDVFFLGEHEDSIALDTTLHWYVSEPINEMTQQFVPVDIRKDLVYVSDTNSCFIDIDSSLHMRGFILVGTTDSLSTHAYRGYDNLKSPVLRVGDNRELYPQGFNSFSPYMNLMVTGKVTDNCWYQTVKHYKLKIGCFFAEYADYNRYEKEHYKSFTQDINKLVRPVVDMKKISQTVLMLKAYIDDDEYYDLVLEIRGVYFLLLSKDYDLGKKKLYHIEKTWLDTRIMEF